MYVIDNSDNNQNTLHELDPPNSMWLNVFLNVIPLTSPQFHLY